MKILLKSAVIIDPLSEHHQKKKDIYLENGIIKKISSSIPSEKGVEEVKFENLHVSNGWFDPGVSFGEPGFEERETIENGLKTAAYSGFTSIGLNANTFPVGDNKGILQFIKSKAAGNAVNLYPIGAMTMGSKGEDLAELYDMTHEGAISFYDYKKPITNANLLKIALQYTQNFNGLIQSFPLEKSVARGGVVNEEINSTKLGLKGIPAFSEELQIRRDIAILEYTGGKLHIPTISTKKAVDLIRSAKKAGLNISCSVAAFNLFLTDDELETFNTNFKLLPPLRTKDDIQALIEGLKDGTIDGVTSDHNPIDVEHKKVEFEHAYFGSIGLESCFGILNKIFEPEEAVRFLTNLKETFHIPSSEIKEGKKADLTLFNPEGLKKFSVEDIVSTSKNSALIGKELKGKVFGILSNNQLIIKD